jgi:hypothetical protein
MLDRLCPSTTDTTRSVPGVTVSVSVELRCALFAGYAVSALGLYRFSGFRRWCSILLMLPAARVGSVDAQLPFVSFPVFPLHFAYNALYENTTSIRANRLKNSQKDTVPRVRFTSRKLNFGLSTQSPCWICVCCRHTSFSTSEVRPPFLDG